MSAPFKLYRLQQIDLQLDRAHARLQEIEAALRQEGALRAAEQRAEAAEQALNARAAALRRAEQDVQAHRIKIEETEAALYGGRIRNPKELQDLQNESAALKRYLAVLEDRQLEAMLAIEEAEKEHAEASANLEAVRRQVSAQNASLVAEQNSLLKEIERQQAERQAAAGAIQPEDLQTYEWLRVQRNGVAVARVADRACSACGSTLSAALLSAARSPNQITRCSTCRRILYAA